MVPTSDERNIILDENEAVTTETTQQIINCFKTINAEKSHHLLRLNPDGRAQFETVTFSKTSASDT